MLKPTNSNQFLSKFSDKLWLFFLYLFLNLPNLNHWMNFLEKSKKNGGSEYPGDYILYGKKKGLANTNTNVSLQS